MLAAALKVGVIAVPVICSLVTAWAVSRLLPVGTGSGRWGYRVLTVLAALLAAMLAERAARRLLPMTTLLKLSLLFPDQAPSRFKVARRSTSTQHLGRLATQSRGGAMGAATTILELLAALTNHDKRTRGHAERVRVYTDLLADQMRLNSADQDLLRWAALLHDIGKLTVDPAILNKPSKPSQREWEILRAHPEQGARAAADLLAWLGEWGPAIVEHHERFDGTGYPKGLAGTAISRAGRMIAVVDAYEVITSARSYKKSTSTLKAREELTRCAGTHFDPAIVRAFLAISLPRLLWATGPLSFFVQLPFIGVLRNAGTRLAGAGGPAVAAVTGAAVVASGATSTRVPTPAPGPITVAGTRQAVPEPTSKAELPRRNTPTHPASPLLATAPIWTPPTAAATPLVSPSQEPPPPPPAVTPPVAPVTPPPVAPSITITGGPIATTSATDATVTFTVSDPAASVSCSLDGATPTGCTAPWTATGLGLGSHTLAITATNAGGTATRSYNWTVAPPPPPPPPNAPPVVTVTGAPVSSTVATDATVSFDVSDPTASITCSLDGAPPTTCANPWSAIGLATGSHTLTIAATNGDGTGFTTYSWMVIPPPVPPPTVTVTSGPPASTTATAATVTFNVSDPTAHVTCSLDGAPGTDCQNAFSTNGLQIGAHTLTVDAWNDAGFTTASYSWTVMALPVAAPTVTIISGPVPSADSTDASVSFAVSDPSAVVTCSLDGSAALPCTNPWTATGLDVGAHTLMISATNAGGTGTATYTWTVTAPPPPPVGAPAVTVSSGPPTSTTSTAATITFAVSDPTATVTCSIDAAPASPCVNSWSAAGLPVGTHTVTVAATNSGGTGTATYTWTITAPPVPAPTVTILNGPPPTGSSTAATVAFTVSDPSATVTCTLDAGPTETGCTTPWTSAALTVGSHTLTIAATNASGTGTATYSWTVSAPPVAKPTVTITAGPVASSSSTTATVSFTVSDPAAVVSCSLDGGPATACTNPWTANSLTVGAHTTTISATNASGTGTASYSWTVTAPPVTPVTVVLTQKPPLISLSSTASFGWSPVAGLSYQCSLDGGPYVACTSPVTYTHLTIGIHTFRVHSTNTVGASGTDTVVTWTAT